MRVVLAPDKFAGTLTATEAALAMQTGWRRSRPGDDLVVRPMSDGGPGFLEVLHPALPGSRLAAVPATDPFGRPVDATVLFDGAHATAYVESALAVGLHLLTEDERDPERASSAGLAALLTAAVEPGAAVERVVVGLGGSATSDGGRGLLTALGDAARRRLQELDLVLASDVANPLLGPNGASAVFGPQKGATREAVARLEGRMQTWVQERPEVAAVAGQAGAGAAGGIGAALLALDGRREAGAQVVATATDLDGVLATADLVVTGEGTYDATSLRGKVAGAVAAAAQAAAIPCAVLAGRIAVGTREAAAHGIDEMLALAEVAGSEQAARDEARHWTEMAAARLASRWGA